MTNAKRRSLSAWSIKQEVDLESGFATFVACCLTALQRALNVNCISPVTHKQMHASLKQGDGWLTRENAQSPKWGQSMRREKRIPRRPLSHVIYHKLYEDLNGLFPGKKAWWGVYKITLARIFTRLSIESTLLVWATCWYPILTTVTGKADWMYTLSHSCWCDFAFSLRRLWLE